MGIQLKKAPALLRLADDAQHVDVVGLAALDQAAGRMRQDMEVRVLERLQDALGLALARELKIAVHRPHHQIQVREHAVGQIERAVGEDIHLDAFEHPDSGQFGVEPIDFVDLQFQAPRIEAVRQAQPARMLGDRQVAQAARAGGKRHVPHAAVPIARLGMHVQIPAQIIELDQPRQLACARRLDFAAILAQFRRDVRQPDCGVHRFLRLPGDALVAAEHAVFIDFQPALLPQFAHRDIVGFRPGEIMQCRAVALLGHDAHIHLNARVQHHARARLASGQNLPDFGIGEEALHHLRGGGGGDQNIDVADSLAHAAETARQHDPPHARAPAQIIGVRVRVLRGNRELVAPRALQMRLDSLQDIELGFFAEPRQRAQPAVARRAVELLRRLHIEILVQPLHPLRPQTGNVQQIGDAGGQLAVEFFEQRASPGGGDLPDLGVEVRTDAGQLGQLAACGEARNEVKLQRLDDACRIAVGAYPERVGLLDLEQVGDFAEDPRDVGVVRCGPLHVGFPGERANERVTSPCPNPGCAPAAAPRAVPPPCSLWSGSVPRSKRHFAAPSASPCTDRALPSRPCRRTRS